MTVEDPIEYYIDGIGQTQVNTKVEMTFARGLRAILRQDPDVVMVGEIRDLETAQIAVQASLTGHLVLSTLHTNTAAGAVTRLRDMGIEPFLLSSSLIGVLAQRLVRVLNPETPPGLQGRRVRAAAAEPARPTSRRRPCTGPGRDASDGYRGRTGIYELVMVDDHMRTMIHDGAGEQELERHARTLTPSIRDDGRARVLRGRDHARGSPARHARGLATAWAHSNTRRSIPAAANATASSRATPPRHVRQLLRERQLLPVTRRTRSREQEKSQKRSFSFGRARRLGHRSGAVHPAARHAGAAGLPLEESLLAVSQQTEKQRVQSIVLGVRAKVMEGHTLADGLADFPRVFPGDLSRHGLGRRAVRAPGCGARAPGRLHREPRADAPEGPGRACSTRSC